MTETSIWKSACLFALSDGVPRRSLYVALIVGTVLNLINQGEARLNVSSINWVKVFLTYCVPYAVCTYGAVSFQLKQRFSHRAVGEAQKWSTQPGGRRNNRS